jgi:hypothetical protein
MRGASTGGGLLSLIAALGLAAPAPASEETSAERAARAAFEAGRELASQERYDEACRKFEESIGFVDAIGTTYNLADCEEHRGHLVRAQELFASVARRAHDLDQREREQVAHDRESALDAKLSLISIEPTAPGVTLSLDGKPLSAEAAKEAISVAPGKHRLSASAKGKKPWSKQLDIPRARLLVPIRVPALEDARAARPAAPPSPAPQRTTAPHRPDSEQRQGSSTLAWLVGGVGIGATAAGAFFGWRYLSKNSDAKAVCPESRSCDSQEIQEHTALVDQARTARSLSYVGFGVGAAALATATVLYFSVGKERPVSAGLGVINDSWAAMVRGSF